MIEISCNLEGTKETLLSTEWRHDCHSVIHNLMDADMRMLCCSVSFHRRVE